MKRLLMGVLSLLFFLSLTGCRSVNPHTDPGLYLYSDDLLAVMIDDQWGYIDTRGRLQIDYQFDGAGAFYEGIALIMNDEKYALIDKKGERISDWYDTLERDVETGLTWYVKDGKLGLLDLKGQPLTDPLYEDIWVGSLSTWVETRFSDGLARVTLDGKYGFIDNRGRVQIDFEWDDVRHFSEGLAVYYDSDEGLYGYINQRGRVAIDPQFRSAGTFNQHGHAVVTLDLDRDHNRAVINNRGRIVFDDCETIGSNDEGYRIKRDGEFLLVNTRGRAHHRDTYETMSYYNDYSYRSGDLLLDLEGNILHEDINSVDNVIYDDGTFYFITYNDDGEATIEYGRRTRTVTMDWIFQIKDGLVTGRRDGDGGVIDLRDRVVIPFEYDGLFITDDDYIVVSTEDDTIGILDLKGNEITDDYFDDINPSLNP